MSLQQKQMVLSRFFDDNVQLVAKMCPRCYEESIDVKILAINLSFLRQVSRNVESDLAKENDEFCGFSDEDIDKSSKYSEKLNQMIETQIERNNNVDRWSFFGFSCEEMHKSEENYKFFMGISKKTYKNECLDMEKMSSTKRNVMHRKTIRRKSVMDQDKESKYFKREIYHSKYFPKAVVKEEIKLEPCEHIIKPILTHTELVLVDYESIYFKSIKTEHQVVRKTEFTWVPPRSPHNLIEEVLHHDPWALLVATIFLNRTSCMCARPYVFWFLTENPDPLTVLGKLPQDLEKYFVRLGLQRTRATQVWRMSSDFVGKDWRNVGELYGIGRYGEDAFRMFCLGDFEVRPRDRFLRIYKAWYEKIRMGLGKMEEEDFKVTA